MANRFLLDIHCALLWFQNNNLKIPQRIMGIIQDPANSIYFSQLSLFEISIKQTINKLPDFTSDISEVYHQAINDGFTFLEVQNNHLYAYKKVPLYEQHRDPFDRLLIATAHQENTVVLTVDKNFSLYKGFIDILW